MKINNKNIFCLATIAAVILVSSFAIASVGKVKGSMHDFSVGGGSQVYQSSTYSQTCVFCHTPHNAGKTGLLWNKAINGNTNFRLYTSSSTLTNTVRKFSSLSAGSPSLLCLGCHDGKTAMNVLHNTGGGAGVNASGAGYPAGSEYIQTTTTGFGPLVMPKGGFTDFFGNVTPQANLGFEGGNDTKGDNLTDDHPIGFSYTDAVADKVAAGSSALNAKGSVNSAIRFFGAKNIVECSTCHDPHVDYSPGGNPALKPFLVMSNSGSALCLSCHNK